MSWVREARANMKPRRARSSRSGVVRVVFGGWVREVRGFIFGGGGMRLLAAKAPVLV